jgi:hypothetical protein
MIELEKKVDGLTESLGVTEKVLLLVAAGLKNQTRLLLLGGLLVGTMQAGVLWAQVEIGRSLQATQRDQRAFFQEVQALRVKADQTAQDVADQPKLELGPVGPTGQLTLQVRKPVSSVGKPIKVPQKQEGRPKQAALPNPQAEPTVEPLPEDVLIPVLAE